MALQEKVEREDLILYELLRNPILCGEFYRTLDIPADKEETFEYTNYQKEFIGDFRPKVSLCCGRSVGKTVSWVGKIVWILINNLFNGEYIVYTVPNKVHLEPVFFGLAKDFRNNTLLKHYMEPRRGINGSSYTVKLLNSAQLMCRIAGTSGTGSNVVGLHTPMIIVDEAGYYPWGTWNELQPVLNSWEEGAQLLVSGVPTGLREHNVLFVCDEELDTFSHHRISAHQNPRYTEQMEEENIEKYHGADSEDYIHFVLGRHGSPTFAVFDRRLMKFEPYPLWKIKFNGIDLDGYVEMVARLALIPDLPENDLAVMGIDLGYTDPTSIVIMYEKKGQLYVHARIEFVKVEYQIQEKLIDYLDTKMGQPEIIGVDAGHSGKAVTQRFLGADEYIHKNYEKRMYPVEFSGWLEIGMTQDGEVIKTKLKPYSVSLLQEMSNSHKIVYSTRDMELVTEMERMTYTKTTSGDISYRTMTPGGGKRGSDHNTSAMLCATLAYQIMTQGLLQTKAKPKLAFSRWVEGV